VKETVNLLEDVAEFMLSTKEIQDLKLDRAEDFFKFLVLYKNKLIII